MEFDKICLNCSSFFREDEDFATDMGVCVNDPAFQPFEEDIWENGDFSNCHELYLEKRFNGDCEPCADYEEPEIMEVDEDDEFPMVENLSRQDFEKYCQYIHDENTTIAENALAKMSYYIYTRNEEAYQVMLDHYRSLGPAEGLEEVHRRIKIIEVLASRGKKAEMVEVLVNELFRTQSNNTTRKLYTKILDRLSRYPVELIQDPLLDLLDKKKYSTRIKNRIQEVAWPIEDEDEEHGYILWF